MDTADVSPLLLGWAVSGFGVIAWFVWRRLRVGPMSRGVTIAYAVLLGASAGVIAFVLSHVIAGAIPVGVLVAVIAYVIIARRSAA